MPVPGREDSQFLALIKKLALLRCVQEQGNVVARRGNAIYDESPKAAETLKMGEDGQLAKIPLVDFYEQIGGSYHQALIEKQFSFELFLKRKAAADLAFDASNIKISDLIVIKKLGLTALSPHHPPCASQLSFKAAGWRLASQAIACFLLPSMFISGHPPPQTSPPSSAYQVAHPRGRSKV